jgi:hypothetical protein
MGLRHAARGELGMLEHRGAHCSAAPPMDEMESRLPNLQSVRTAYVI